MHFFMSVLRIAIAVAVVNGAARTASVYWSFYQLKDHAQQMAIFGWQTPTEVIHTTVMAKAGELRLPVTEEQLRVTRDGPVTMIEANYVQPVEYFPHREYPLKLSFNVEGRNLTANTVPQ